MSFIYRVLALISLIIVLIFILLNISNSILIETSFLSLKVNVGFLILFCSVLSSMSVLLFMISTGSKADIRFKNQTDRAKLNYEIESDKVKQLEAKIKTLEEALRIATKK